MCTPNYSLHPVSKAARDATAGGLSSLKSRTWAIFKTSISSKGGGAGGSCGMVSHDHFITEGMEHILPLTSEIILHIQHTHLLFAG